MEYKVNGQFITGIADRTVTGIFAVHGNVDAGGDRSYPGAFAATIAADMRRIKYLWMHDPQQPPIAVIRSLREITRAQLPAAVLAVAPNATGGVEVVREYLPSARGDEVLAGIRAGAITELSYGYDAVRWDMSTEGNKQVRNLREVRLWDVSDVIWGLNPATVGSKRRGGALTEQQRTVQRLYLEYLRNSARFSGVRV